MGRTKLYDNPVTVGVRMPEELAKLLQEEAANQDMSRNELVVKLLTQALTTPMEEPKKIEEIEAQPPLIEVMGLPCLEDDEEEVIEASVAQPPKIDSSKNGKKPKLKYEIGYLAFPGSQAYKVVTGFHSEGSARDRAIKLNEEYRYSGVAYHWTWGEEGSLRRYKDCVIGQHRYGD
jgi:hypothetical protein